MTPGGITSRRAYFLFLRIWKRQLVYGTYCENLGLSGNFSGSLWRSFVQWGRENHSRFRRGVRTKGRVGMPVLRVRFEPTTCSKQIIMKTNRLLSYTVGHLQKNTRNLQKTAHIKKLVLIGILDAFSLESQALKST